ncbi:MAG: DUF5678 domain-containing protein [Acidobacteria bacterium]|nr:DUF5678 domain-containing protein [Acidobacteriota bacterium]
MNLSYEQINGAIDGLPLIEQKRLLDELKDRLESALAANGASINDAENNAAGDDFQWPDPTPNNAWLNEHAREYQGEWVALYNGRLLAHGNDSKVLAGAVKLSGAPLPLILFIPPESSVDVAPFIGWL